MNDMKYLEEFLLDIDILKELDKFTKEVNLFELLQIADSELKHSIVLAYLLDPNENHGLGSSALSLLFKKLSLNDQIDQLSIFDLLDIDFSDFSIIREYKHIDILIKSQKNKIVLCIENKIWTKEHSNQLAKYKRVIEEEFSDYKQIFLYLTPGGEESSDAGNWFNFSYQDIIDVLDGLEKENINNKIKIIIDDYKAMVRRNIMNDSELKDVCNMIYKKHKYALDLIWENKENESYYVYNIITEYLEEKALKGEINYDVNNSTKTYLRFTTPYLDSKFPLLEDNVGNWGNKHTVFYEIIIGKIQLKTQIAFGGKGVDQNEQIKLAHLHAKALGFSQEKNRSNYGYIVWPFPGNISFKKLTMEEEIDRDFIYKELDRVLGPIYRLEKKNVQ